MFNFFKLNSTPLVGVDISSGSIKAVELSLVEQEYVVETYGIELLPPLSVVEKNVKAVDKVTETIRKLAKRVGIKRRYAALAVAGSSVLTRVIQINAGYDDNQIIEQIELEADRYIPYPMEEVYFDFEVIGPSAKHPDLVDVLLASSRMETLDIRVAALTEAGFKTTIVDVETLAMERAFPLVAAGLPEKGQGSNIALVDIGATNTGLYVFRDGVTLYNRDQAFGGKHLTDEIQRRYSLSPEEAVVAQKYGGLPEDYTTEVLEPFKEVVVQQINRALQVFFSSSNETAIHYIVLAGGAAILPGLDVLLQNKLAIKTIVANPFSEMRVSAAVNRAALMENAPSLMIACGLALRNFNDEQN